jgi:rhamnosyltransferase
VIVTFHPKRKACDNLAKVRPQVQGLVVVDNGSSAEALTPFRLSSEALHFELIENSENLGIAAALNIGVRWAKSQGYEFVVLFDQDSTVTDGFIRAMLAEFKLHPQQGRIAILMPRYFNPNTGHWQAQGCKKDGNPLVAYTSGSLIPMRIFDACGLFEEDLIVDCVDSEYCLRAGRHGYIVVLCQHAVLWHSVGNTQVHSFLGFRTIEATHHSAARRYYITRNHLVVIGRYWRIYPYWCYRTLNSLFRLTIKILLFEDRRWAKLANIVRGVFDAVRGRMG